MTLLKRKIRPALAMPLATLLAVAVTLVAAASLAPPGPTDAQSGNIRYVTAGDLSHCGPGADNPPPNPDQVIDGGHFALFDVYWDNSGVAGSGKTLNNNLCPPAVTDTEETTESDEGEVTTNTFTRAASGVDIRETLFHVPTDRKVSLAAATAPATGDPVTFGADKYGFLGSANDEVWIVKSHDKGHLNPGFSTALLPDDFLTAGTKVEFVLESVRVPGETLGDRGVIYVFENADTDNDSELEVKWRSDDVDDDIIELAVGGDSVKRYQHYHWAFTKPGTYKLQVHAKAHPAAQYLPSSTVQYSAVTSEVRVYTIQVGALADLSVDVTASNATPSATDTVALTYKATNNGPDAAGEVKVKAPLPDGLTYASQTGGAYSVNGEWDIGSLASGGTATLTVNATVDSGFATGEMLTATAYIHDTGANPDLDPIVGNNHATVSVRPGAPANSNPQFRVVRSVSENVRVGSPVGDPVTAIDPDGDSLSYTLSGPHFERFAVDEQGQITTSQLCGVMDYEAHAVYPLTLSVRDSKNSAGTTDKVTDASIGVLIRVTDVIDEADDANAGSLTVQPDHETLTVGQTVTLTAVGTRLPSCSVTDHYYYFWRESVDGGISWRPITAFRGSTATFTYNTPGERRYRVNLDNLNSNLPDGPAAQPIGITWQAASQ